MERDRNNLYSNTKAIAIALKFGICYGDLLWTPAFVFTVFIKNNGFSIPILE